MAELGKDIAATKQLIVVDAKAEQSAKKTRASVIAGMSDGMVKALEFHRVQKAKGRTAANATFLDAFGERFKHGPQTPPPAPPGP